MKLYSEFEPENLFGKMEKCNYYFDKFAQLDLGNATWKTILEFKISKLINEILGDKIDLKDFFEIVTGSEFSLRFSEGYINYTDLILKIKEIESSINSDKISFDYRRSISEVRQSLIAQEGDLIFDDDYKPFSEL